MVGIVLIMCEYFFRTGGNIDGASKTLIGVASSSGYDPDQTLFLIAVSSPQCVM